MLTAGKRAPRPHRRRSSSMAFAVFMHLVAFSIVAKFAEIEPDADRGTLVVITGCALLAWSLMMSQAMESVTRAFYARSDLDLILSSPVASRRVFAVRIATMAVSTVLMAVLLAAPFINVLVWRGGARWLAAYGVVIAVGATAAALSVALTVALFRTIGPKRTRLAAQIVAAIVGATFVIGVQVAAILSYGTLSLLRLPASPTCWWRSCRRSTAWSGGRRAPCSATSTALRRGARRRRRCCSARRSRCSRRASASTPSPPPASPTPACASAAGATASAAPRRSAALRRKEWTLLRRDPWLASQTLMQLLYLLPPALMLWRAFGQQQRRSRAAGAGAGDGGGPARRRPRLARDLRRGRARPRRHRADPGALHRPRQDRGGDRQRRAGVRAVRRRRWRSPRRATRCWRPPASASRRRRRR